MQMQMQPRLLGVLYIAVVCFVLHAIVRHLYTGFLMFCVMYTCSDVYKKRRKYMWIVRIVKGNVGWLVYALIGEDTINALLCVRKPKRKFDKTSALKQC